MLTQQKNAKTRGRARRREWERRILLADCASFLRILKLILCHLA